MSSRRLHHSTLAPIIALVWMAMAFTEILWKEILINQTWD
jgi:hypothetical protein